MTLVKGSIVYSKQLTWAMAQPGTKGVCHDVAEINGKPRYAVIFENGMYDGYTPWEAENYLTDAGRVCPEITNYQFTDAQTLMADFKAGRFDAAFRPPKPPVLKLAL